MSHPDASLETTLKDALRPQKPNIFGIEGTQKGFWTNGRLQGSGFLLGSRGISRKRMREEASKDGFLLCNLHQFFWVPWSMWSRNSLHFTNAQSDDRKTMTHRKPSHLLLSCFRTKVFWPPVLYPLWNKALKTSNSQVTSTMSNIFRIIRTLKRSSGNPGLSIVSPNFLHDLSQASLWLFCHLWARWWWFPAWKEQDYTNAKTLF